MARMRWILILVICAGAGPATKPSTQPSTQPTTRASEDADRIEKAIQEHKVVLGMTAEQVSRSLRIRSFEVVSENEDGKTCEWKFRVIDGNETVTKYLDALVSDETVTSYEWSEERETNASKREPRKTQRAREFRGTEGIPDR